MDEDAVSARSLGKVIAGPSGRSCLRGQYHSRALTEVHSAFCPTHRWWPLQLRIVEVLGVEAGLPIGRSRRENRSLSHFGEGRHSARVVHLHVWPEIVA